MTCPEIKESKVMDGNRTGGSAERDAHVSSSGKTL